MSDYRGDEPMEEFGGGDGRNDHSAFVIATPGQLKKLIVESRKSCFKGKHFLLTTDFRITSDTWEPIGSTPIHSFNGFFDGNGHTITGTLENANGQKLFGFFGYLKDATVINLNIEATIRNIANNTVYCYTGSIAGYSNHSAIIECTHSGSIETAMSGSIYTGGIVGISYNHSLLKHYTNRGEINGESTQNTYIGGIVGDNTTCSTIVDCTNRGIIKGISCSMDADNEIYVGGIGGRNSQSSNLIRSSNQGPILGNSQCTFSYVGGIVGQSTHYCQVESCNNLSPTVEGSGRIAYIGGIAGNNDTGSIIDLCSNRAAITGLGSFCLYAGGIVGFNLGSHLYNCCTNSGHVNQKEPVADNNYLRSGGNISVITACPNGHDA